TKVSGFFVLEEEVKIEQRQGLGENLFCACFFVFGKEKKSIFRENRKMLQKRNSSKKKWLIQTINVFYQYGFGHKLANHSSNFLPSTGNGAVFPCRAFISPIIHK